VPSVLVTGSSSGIGRAAVERLAADGWRVFAGVRDFSDGTALDEIGENVTALALDVTDEEQIAATAAEVRSAPAALLNGIVANAGIGVGGALEEIEPARLREVVDAGLDAEGGALYAGRLAEFAEQLESADENGDEAGKVAGKIAAALTGSGGRYPVGRGAGAITRLRPLVPDLVWDRVVGRFAP
jgi:NAD(P)-dependent dehydrogenase (short-subunit alcohol dehydrogenase family)